MEDLYKILGVSRGIEAEELKKTYRNLAKKYHPDVNPGSVEAETKFKEITNAYDILSDPQKLAAYERGDAAGNPNYTQAHYGTSPFSGFSHTGTGGFADINDIFNNIFAQQGFGRQQVYQNQHIQLSYQISLEEAYHGKESEISFSFKDKLHQKLRLTVPAAIDNGMRLRFSGKGDDSIKGVPVGDLYITIGVLEHAKFKRIDHLTLLTTESISYIDAILGTIREIKTIDGSTVQIAIPSDILPSTVLKVSGKGMREPFGLRGDLLVEIKVTPPHLTESQKLILTKIQNDIKMTVD